MSGTKSTAHVLLQSTCRKCEYQLFCFCQTQQTTKEKKVFLQVRVSDMVAFGLSRGRN